MTDINTILEKPTKVTYLHQDNNYFIGTRFSGGVTLSANEALRTCLAILHHAYRVPEESETTLQRDKLTDEERLHVLVRKVADERNSFLEKIEEQEALLQKYRVESSLARVRRTLKKDSEKATDAQRKANDMADEVITEFLHGSGNASYIDHPMIRDGIERLVNASIPRGGKLEEGKGIPTHDIDDQVLDLNEDENE